MESVSRHVRTSPQAQTLGAAIEEEIESDLRSKRTYKYGLPFGKPYVESTSGAQPKEVNPPKSSSVDVKPRRKSKSCNNKDDEIVRHMSNLPSFLQQAQRKDTVQEKALNFGVLDWKRLEKWKYSEHMPPLHHQSKKMLPPKGTSSPNSAPKLGENLKGGQRSLHGVDTVLLSSGKPISHDLRFGKPQRCSAMKEKEEKYVRHLKFKEKETWLEEFEAARKVFNPGKMDLHDTYSYEGNVENQMARNRKKVVIPEMKASSSEFNETKFSSFSHDNTSSSQRPSKERGLKNEVRSISRYRTVDEQSQNRDRRTFSGSPHSNDFTTSSDGQFSGPSSSSIPHSCPLSSATTANAESLVDPPQKSVSGKSRRHSFTIESSEQQPNLKGSDSSPSRRFSFSFARLNRSSSCKEGSTIPRLSLGATGNKSGPLFPENSLLSSGIEGDKGNVSGRRRSSPLRRLFEPLTKHRRGKSTEESVQTSNVSSESAKRMNSCSEGQSHDRKSVQALLQVSLKNGFPFFKLVDDNSKDMLAAVLTSEKPSVYMFYSVQEIKKKSSTLSWIGQGSKNKNSSLGYKILGQMKVSNRCRECVLHGVDPQQQKGDGQNSEFSLGQEIAALVFQGEISSNPEGMIVILPGGVHGIPAKGGHSSLISRWRTAGSCDCGGWDIGCKLRILTNDLKNRASNVGHGVNLYVQERTQSKAKPVFSMEPLSNGLYSVKLMENSMSLLEAFAACVGLVTCREFSALLESRGMLGTEDRRVDDDGNKKAGEGNYFSCPPLSPAGRI